MLGSLLSILAAQSSSSTVTIGESVLVGILSAVVAVGAAYGLLKGQVVNQAARADVAERRADQAEARIKQCELDSVVLKTQMQQFDSIRGEIGALEARLAQLLGEKLEGLRRELRAGGHLDGARHHSGG